MKYLIVALVMAMLLLLFQLFSSLRADGVLRPDYGPPGATPATPAPMDGQAPVDSEPGPPKRTNFSSSVYGFVIVHGPNADSISAEVNRRLSRGFFLRGPLRVERTGAGELEYIQPMNREIH